MNKKYQVFVSSTYKDLKEERSGVITAVLGIGCIPVAMDSFQQLLFHNGITKVFFTSLIELL